MEAGPWSIADACSHSTLPVDAGRRSHLGAASKSWQLSRHSRSEVATLSMLKIHYKQWVVGRVQQASSSDQLPMSRAVSPPPEAVRASPWYATLQSVPLPSSVTIKEPSFATATPTGLPQTWLSD